MTILHEIVAELINLVILLAHVRLWFGWVSADLDVIPSGKSAGESDARPATVQAGWLATARGEGRNLLRWAGSSLRASGTDERCSILRS